MESPGLALRVEIPFSRQTPKRVPEGTTILSVEAGRAGAADAVGAAATDGADCCGPSGCCAFAPAAHASMATAMAALQTAVVTLGRVFMAPSDSPSAMPPGEPLDA